MIAGSSTVFGIGASADRHTLASRHSRWRTIRAACRGSISAQAQLQLHAGDDPVLAQPAITLPKCEGDRAVLRFQRPGPGAVAEAPAGRSTAPFFMCNDFFDAMGARKQSRFSSWFQSGRKASSRTDEIPTLDEQIDYAARLVLRNLANWRAMAQDMGAELTFVLQPLANWVRRTEPGRRSPLHRTGEERPVRRKLRRHSGGRRLPRLSGPARRRGARPRRAVHRYRAANSRKHTKGFLAVRRPDPLYGSGPRLDGKSIAENAFAREG